MIHKHCATLCAIIRSHSFILLPLRLRIILYRPSLLSEQPVGVLFSFSLRENKNLKDIRSKKNENDRTLHVARLHFKSRAEFAKQARV